jgi:hypothetical protein
MMSDEVRRDQLPEALPAEQPRPKLLTCWYCGSQDLTRGLELGMPGEAGKVGITFEATGKFLGISLLGKEPLSVTLCNECGTVVRLSVKDSERNWS